MDIIFSVVASTLNIIALITGLTYNEINIIVYYIIIPFTYFALIDYYFQKHYLKIIWIVITIIFFATVKLNTFSDRLFEKSVDFLNIFNFVGFNYINASVIICVFVVLLIYLILIFLIYNKRKKQTNCIRESCHKKRRFEQR